MNEIKQHKGQFSNLQYSKLSQSNVSITNTDKESILDETQAFNSARIQNENCRKILAKLIYLLNQGVILREQEKEQLFFRVTKLFQSNDAGLRRLTYKILKVILPKKYIYVILQSLINDLSSNNQLFKREALKFIPFIQDESYAKQIERHIQNALFCRSVLVQSTALLVGIQIMDRVPGFQEKLTLESLQRLDQSYETFQFHAIILLQHSMKSNQPELVKFLISLTKMEFKPLVHIQIIKFIQEILPQTSSADKKELVDYLFQQYRVQIPQTIYQSTKILISDPEIQNYAFSDMMSFIEKNLNSRKTHLQNVSSFLWIQELVKFKKRQVLINLKQVRNIHSLLFNQNVTRSYMGILFFMKLNYSNIGLYLGKQFTESQDNKVKLDFLKGLYEIIYSHPEFISLVLETLQRGFHNHMDTILVEYAITIIEQILIISDKYLPQTYLTLIRLIENPGNKNKLNAIKLADIIKLKMTQKQINQLQQTSAQKKPISKETINKDIIEYLDEEVRWGQFRMELYKQNERYR